jgi:hypothetical protein
MTSLTTVSTISSFDRFAAQPEAGGHHADRQRAAVAAQRSARRAGLVAAVLALHRVLGTRRPYGCRQEAY